MDRREVRQLGKGLAFLSPWVVGFLIFTLLPIILSFYYSLCDYTLLQPPVFIGMENYRDLMNDDVFWRSLRTTFTYAAMALPAGLLVSLGLALLLNVTMPGQALFRTIIFLPSLVPIVASAMLWMWLFNTKLGLINALLDTSVGHALIWMINQPLRLMAWLELIEPFRIELPVGWLTNPSVALPALALMSLWGVGHTVVIYLAGLQDVPKELYEAAEIDGAGLWGRLWHVTIPMLSPVIFFNLIIAIIGVLQVFDVPYIMTQGGPARATYFITMYLRDNAFRDLHMGYASAMAWIMLLLVMMLTGFAFWTSKRWVHYQGK